MYIINIYIYIYIHTCLYVYHTHRHMAQQISRKIFQLSIAVFWSQELLEALSKKVGSLRGFSSGGWKVLGFQDWMEQLLKDRDFFVEQKLNFRELRGFFWLDFPLSQAQIRGGLLEILGLGDLASRFM